MQSLPPVHSPALGQITVVRKNHKTQTVCSLRVHCKYRKPIEVMHPCTHGVQEGWRRGFLRKKDTDA